MLSDDRTRAETDAHFMSLALREAAAALKDGEVPIGAVIVYQSEVIGRGFNQNKTLKDPTAHAEMIAISAACNHRQSRYLEDATLYVTVEPCAMCAGAIVLSRLSRLVFGAHDPKAGACGSILNLVQEPRLNHLVEVSAGVREMECAELISSFFEAIRRREKQ